MRFEDMDLEKVQKLGQLCYSKEDIEKMTETEIEEHLLNNKITMEEDITQNDMDRMSDVENEREEEANTTRNE